jgi:uncharacterized membrane protein YgaE (UPF0421/DUF939 family)
LETATVSDPSETLGAMLKIRSRLGEELTRRLTRWRNTAMPIVQAALAAGLSWLVAVHIVDHRAPFFAPVAAVVCLGITLGQRLRRVVELIVGVGLGVGVGDLLIPAIGTGPWQIALAVALAMSVAVLLDGGAVIAVQSAVSAILLVTLYLPGDTSGLNRLVDGLIGGVTGLVVVGSVSAKRVSGLRDCGGNWKARRVVIRRQRRAPRP